MFKYLSAILSIFFLSSISFPCDYLPNPYGNPSCSYANEEGCYPTEEKALAACLGDGGGCTLSTVPPDGYEGAVPAGTKYYYRNYSYCSTIDLYWVYAGPQGCDCIDEKAAAEQECGGAEGEKYTMDYATCQHTCTGGDCIDEKAAAEQECGGAVNEKNLSQKKRSRIIEQASNKKAKKLSA